MSRLPLIVGFGGINAAGRSSFHQGFKRLVLDALSPEQQQATLADLSRLMGLSTQGDDAALAQQFADTVRRHTLIRRIEASHFNVDALTSHRRLPLKPVETLRFRLRQRELPAHIPADWEIKALEQGEVEISTAAQQNWLLEDRQPFPVTSAGQLPSGFDPEHLYPSRHHPRALQMTVFGASDALHSVGYDIDTLKAKLRPDRIAVYASSAHGQLDDYGTGGLFKFPWQGKRTSSKQCPLGFAEMPADFINAYVLGSSGRTGGSLGACATFLYNLERAVQDIQHGLVDFAVVGATEAPIIPELMEGYRAMGALGEDTALLKLDQARGINQLDHSRATRPFGYNAGFTIAESAQFLVLTSDSLALELGLNIHGAVPGVFIHADGFKKSISAPGIGNYLTLGKAAHLTRSLLGDKGLREHSYIQAHGTGTPQNRVTESHVFNETAKAFAIEQWLIASVKCYVGHSLGAAAGDQVMAALGSFAHGIVPGIFTLDDIPADVHRSHLRFSQQHIHSGNSLQACLVNSKGFGGNNASAVLLSPAATHKLLVQKHGTAALAQWQKAQEQCARQADAYDQEAHAGHFTLRYRFGAGVVDGHELQITDQALSIPGLPLSADLAADNPFSDYLKK